MTTSRVGIWATWLALFVAATLTFGRISQLPELRVSHGVIVYLLLIIGASRQGGGALSVVMVVLSYLAVDYFFVPPRFQLGGASELDWLILVGFAFTGLLISQMFAGLQRAVAVATERTLEVERLSAERLQLEREASTARVLQEADRIKNALLTSLAHDLRSPVATLQLISDPAAGFAPHAALLRVSDEATRLGDFLSVLDRFATTGVHGLETRVLDAETIVQTALRSSQAILRARDVRVRRPPSPMWVRCDLTLSVQVLGNLLQNAARHAPASAPIDVLFQRADQLSEIVVADRGPGLADDDVERLFSPLRRRERSIAPGSIAPGSEADGVDTRMGMGLSIARTFARAQQGDVLYRPRPGGGAEFVLRLPVGEAPPAT
jgi:two-component system sensor histidine kinase KdpD